MFFCGFGSVTSIDLVNVGVLRITFNRTRFLQEIGAVLGEVAQLERTFRISIIVPTAICDGGESVRTVYRIVLLAIHGPAGSAESIVPSGVIHLVPRDRGAGSGVRAVPWQIMTLLVHIQSRSGMATFVVDERIEFAS